MDDRLFKFGVWLIRALLDKALQDPQKRHAVIDQARMLVVYVQDALAELERVE